MSVLTGESPFQWTPEEERYTRLFNEWMELPFQKAQGTTPESIQCLWQLDALIVGFDKHIQHSDAGFAEWRDRHQTAMEVHQSPAIAYPNLLADARGRKKGHTWNNKAWETRYTYLIRQRAHMVEQRLCEMELKKYAAPRFFSREPEKPPRSVFISQQGKVRKNPQLKCNWWWPINQLLRPIAEDLNMPPEELVALFWTLCKVKKEEILDEDEKIEF